MSGASHRIGIAHSIGCVPDKWLDVIHMQEDDVDPLDAFMDAAVNPEVAAAEKAEAARKEELRKQQVKALAVSAALWLLFSSFADLLHVLVVVLLCLHGYNAEQAYILCCSRCRLVSTKFECVLT